MSKLQHMSRDMSNSYFQSLSPHNIGNEQSKLPSSDNFFAQAQAVHTASAAHATVSKQSSPRFCKMVVSVENPYSILATEAGIDNIFGHCTNDLRFRTIQVFEGPGTDQSLFRVAIHKTIVREESRYQLILYDAYGRPHNKLVSFSPYHDAPGAKYACLITVENSDAILLTNAFKDSNCAQALVAAEWPHQIHMVNDEFSRAFAFDPTQALGRPVSVLHNDRTDVLRWCTLLQSACEGQADSSFLSFCARSKAPVHALCRCVPVVEDMNGKIRFALLQFHPTAHADFLHEPSSFPAPASNPHPSPQAHRRWPDPASPPARTASQPGSRSPHTPDNVVPRRASSAEEVLVGARQPGTPQVLAPEPTIC